MSTDDPLAAEQPPAFDDAALARLKRFGGGKLLNEMIALFLVAAPERLASAKQGMAAGEALVVEMALHSLKSSAGQLGALRMQALSARGEQLARERDLTHVGTLVRDLEDELARVHAWLTNVREGGMA